MPPRDISIIKVSDVVLQKAGNEMEAHNSIRRYLHRIGEENTIYGGNSEIDFMAGCSGNAYC